MVILTCTQKLTWVSLIYRTEPKTKKWKTEQLKSKKNQSISKQSRVNMESILKIVDSKEFHEIKKFSVSCIAWKETAL